MKKECRKEVTDEEREGTKKGRNTERQEGGKEAVCNLFCFLRPVSQDSYIRAQDGKNKEGKKWIWKKKEARSEGKDE